VNRSKRVVFASLLNAPELDEKIEEATSAPDFETQKVLIREVQDLIYNKYVQLVPLYHIELQYIKYPYVKDSNFYTVISHGQWAPGTEWLDR
jgi:ABC-type transport system substrate-binding protein